MIGRHSGNQDWLFYAFNLDDHVPSNHLLRGIDSVGAAAMGRNASEPGLVWMGL
jgi:hypothetical protein